MNDEGNVVLSAPTGHGSMEAFIFKLLGVDKKSEELYALEHMSKQPGNKPYYRQKERY